MGRDRKREPAAVDETGKRERERESRCSLMAGLPDVHLGIMSSCDRVF